MKFSHNDKKAAFQKLPFRHGGSYDKNIKSTFWLMIWSFCVLCYSLLKARHNACKLFFSLVNAGGAMDLLLNMVLVSVDIFRVLSHFKSDLMHYFVQQSWPSFKRICGGGALSHQFWMLFTGEWERMNGATKCREPDYQRVVLKDSSPYHYMKVSL